MEHYISIQKFLTLSIPMYGSLSFFIEVGLLHATK